MEDSTRRRLLRTGNILFITGLAGCSQNMSDDDTNNTNAESKEDSVDGDRKTAEASSSPNIDISVDENEVEVPGRVTVTAEAGGSNLNSMTIEYKNSNDNWVKIGNTKGCTGEKCAIIREKGESSPVSRDFRARVADDSGSITTSSDITVDFVEIES